MDKYRKVKKEKEQTPENEIRVTTMSRFGNCLRYINELLINKKYERITITATGNAIARAVSLAILSRKKFKGLHQFYDIESMEMKDEYEPLEQGLNHIIRPRNVALIKIKLATTVEKEETKLSGYQAPLSDSEIDPYQDHPPFRENMSREAPSRESYNEKKGDYFPEEERRSRPYGSRSFRTRRYRYRYRYRYPSRAREYRQGFERRGNFDYSRRGRGTYRRRRPRRFRQINSQN